MASLDMLPDSAINYMVQAAEAERMERERFIRLLDLGYVCGAAYCDDPACQMHSPIFNFRCTLLPELSDD